MDTSFPARKSPAHPPPRERCNTPIVIHVTVCACERRAIFNNAAAHAALLAAWNDATQWHVAEYVIMPDHIHLFCIPGVLTPEPLKSWVGFWKRLAGQNDPALKGVWQRQMWDTQIRDQDHYTEKVSYMRMNPVRRELVATPEAWPYAAKLRPIIW